MTERVSERKDEALVELIGPLEHRLVEIIEEPAKNQADPRPLVEPLGPIVYRLVKMIDENPDNK